VPQVTQLIKTMRVEIPIQTRMLTLLSDTVRAWSRGPRPLPKSRAQWT
jgi:hypothetical protein